MSLIERLEEANQHLIGSKEHHDSINEAIGLISLADRIVRGLLPVMEAARPLVMNLENLKDYKELRR